MIVAHSEALESATLPVAPPASGTDDGEDSADEGGDDGTDEGGDDGTDEGGDDGTDEGGDDGTDGGDDGTDGGDDGTDDTCDCTVECKPLEERERIVKFERALEDMVLNQQVAGVPNCSYQYRERRNNENMYMSLFKIDCPDQPDRVFDFVITQDNWEWEQGEHMYHDYCSDNCSESQLINSEANGDGRTAMTFQLSHASGQTKGGFIGPADGYGYRRYRVNTSN